MLSKLTGAGSNPVVSFKADWSGAVSDFHPRSCRFGPASQVPRADGQIGYSGSSGGRSSAHVRVRSVKALRALPRTGTWGAGGECASGLCRIL